MCTHSIADLLVQPYVTYRTVDRASRHKYQASSTPQGDQEAGNGILSNALPSSLLVNKQNSDVQTSMPKSMPKVLSQCGVDDRTENEHDSWSKKVRNIKA
jgi:hypothetical protein